MKINDIKNFKKDQKNMKLLIILSTSFRELSYLQRIF